MEKRFSIPEFQVFNQPICKFKYSGHTFNLAVKPKDGSSGPNSSNVEVMINSISKEVRPYGRIVGVMTALEDKSFNLDIAVAQSTGIIKDPISGELRKNDLYVPGIMTETIIQLVEEGIVSSVSISPEMLGEGSKKMFEALSESGRVTVEIETRRGTFGGEKSSYRVTK